MTASFYIVHAAAQAEGTTTTVWIGRRTTQALATWRWEVLGVLWQSMGTAATAAWVAEQYLQVHAEGATEVGSPDLAEAVAQALRKVKQQLLAR